MSKNPETPSGDQSDEVFDSTRRAARFIIVAEGTERDLAAARAHIESLPGQLPGGTPEEAGLVILGVSVVIEGEAQDPNYPFKVSPPPNRPTVAGKGWADWDTY
jgi:hypothetical protein